MAGRIFISYRRESSAGHTGRIYDRLAQEFGESVLFMDVDSIPLGSDFVKVLQKEVSSCDVLLAIIGPNWIDSYDKSGRRRLDDPDDFVRVEISTALERDIPVIPILLEGASIPERDSLPNDLKDLSRRNGMQMRHESFHADIEKLTRFLRDRFAFPRASTLPGNAEAGNATIPAVHDSRKTPDPAVRTRHRGKKIAGTVAGGAVLTFIVAGYISDSGLYLISGHLMIGILSTSVMVFWLIAARLWFR